jgi:hypothetical protein
MFSLKKLGRGIGLSKGGVAGIKYSIDVQVVSVDGLPDSVKKCRVVMGRGAKISMTDVKDTRAGDEKMLPHCQLQHHGSSMIPCRNCHIQTNSDTSQHNPEERRRLRK